MNLWTLSSRGDVSGWPRYIWSEPPKIAIAANRRSPIRTMCWLTERALFMALPSQGSDQGRQRETGGTRDDEPHQHAFDDGQVALALDRI